MTLHVMRPFSARLKVYTQLAARRASSSGRANRFDITHRSHVVRSSSPRSKQDRDSMAAWKLSGAFTRFDRSFEVFEVSKAGELKRTSVTLAKVLRDFGVHARDMLSLGLQDERYIPPPAVLPRQGVVVIALGPFKALVHTEACLLFEAGKIDVAHMAPLLAELMQANNEVPPSECPIDVSGVGEPSQSPTPPPSRPLERSDEAKDSDDVSTARRVEDFITPENVRNPRDRSKSPPQPWKEEDPITTDTATAAAGNRKSTADVAAGTAEAVAAVAGRAAAESAAAAASAIAGGRAHVETKASQEPHVSSDHQRIREGTGAASQQQTTTTTTVTTTTTTTAAVDEDQSAADKLATKLGEYVEGALRFGAGGGARDGAEGEEEEEEIEEHQMKVMFREQLPMPFELAILEAMLQEVCTTYHRRAHVVRRLMEQGLKPSETTTFFAPSRIEHYRVVPLKLALNQLELKLSQTRACLEELMRSDEDMLGLLLTELKGLGTGEVLDPHRHSVVELLLESYHRQLVLVGHDVAAMKQEMESLQELSAISLDVSLNSMIAVDVRLAMLNLGVATSACIFGAMGMNTVNGFESSNVAFYALLGGSTVASALALGGVMRHLRSLVRAGDSQQGKLMALNTICDHVDDIESVLRTELESTQTAARGGSNGEGDCDGAGVIRRKAMADKLSQVRGKEISQEELDLIFEVFDTSGDGTIDTREYGKLVSEPAGSLGSNTGILAEGAASGSLPSRERRPTI